MFFYKEHKYDKIKVRVNPCDYLKNNIITPHREEIKCLLSSTSSILKIIIYNKVFNN